MKFLTVGRLKMGTQLATAAPPRFRSMPIVAHLSDCWALVT